MTKNVLRSDDEVQYKVNEYPPWFMCVVLGLQHYISMMVGSLSIPFLLSPLLCIGEDHVGKSQLISTLFVASGIITILQVTMGVRLAIVQAGTFALLAPTLSYLSLPQFKCPILIDKGSNVTYSNGTFVMISGSDEHRELWQSRIREIQGSIMVSSIFEIFLGFSGALGFLLKYIGPLSVCPTITLMGTSLFKSAANNASQHWWICLMTVLLIVVFSQHLGHINIPCGVYNKYQGCHKKKYPLFKMFPVVLGIGVSWLICYVLTLSNVLPNDSDKWGYQARTDVRSSVLSDAPWFRIPYPGQWGTPTVNTSLVCGLLSGYLASVVQSVGDYTNCARLSGAAAPPKNAISRGIGVEGLGCLIAGAFGTGNGTSSTSINVGVVGLTKTGSRVIIIYAAIMMIVFGTISKLGALFVTLPDPVVGGAFFIFFGMIVAVGISSLQAVDLNSSRNLFVFGFSFFFALTVSEWVKDNPDAIKTGNNIADNVLTVLLGTSMFLGGVMGFLLDNTIPGTPEERGLKGFLSPAGVTDKTQTTEEIAQQLELTKTYELPFGMRVLKGAKWAKYIPFSPTYETNSYTTLEEDTDIVPRSIDV